MSKTTHREDHLKALYALGHSGASESEWVSTNQMASHLGVKPPSVTAMVHVLTELGWAEHRPYHGARLTPAGEKLALALVRKHRLWETFLVERLGFEWDEVHDIAEQLEHVDSVALVERLDQYLGHPDVDPHGDPIPKADGTFRNMEGVMPLSELGEFECAVVMGVKANDQTLSAMRDRGLGLGSKLTKNDLVTLPQAWLTQLMVKTS